ncbi:MAG: SGNH/GDSL hydrolase family protein [Methylomonas sp.]|jgi:phospholipase/lecithinase/hemolysin
MRVKNCILGLLFSVSFGAGPAGASAFSSFYVFGDSLSDIGSSPSAVMSVYNLLLDNCDPSYPCPPYYEGRFSNGPVTAEYLANAVLPGGANSANFHDYAVGGSTTGIGNVGDGGSATNIGLGFPGMEAQFAAYFTSSIGTTPNPNALFMVWGGGNDLTYGGSVTTAADNIAGYVDELAASGAKNILVPNLPDLGLTPDALAQGTAAAQALNLASQQFNQLLATQLSNLSEKFPGVRIVDFDTYDFFDNLLKNAVNYGFTDITDACVSASFQACSNPASYIFWDGEHPTTHVDSILGPALADAMTAPLPPAAWLFAAGLYGLYLNGNIRRNNHKRA